MDIVPVARRRATTWNSVAASIEEYGDENRVEIGYGMSASRERAVQIAVEQCREAGGENCASKGVWNYGCVYITTGKGPGARVGWQSAATRREVLGRCEAKYNYCKPPIGGCVR